MNTNDRDEALRLCRRVREQQSAATFPQGPEQCRRCTRESGESPDRMMMMARRTRYTGCVFMNRLRTRS
jgi:hypothetical protein